MFGPFKLLLVFTSSSFYRLFVKCRNMSFNIFVHTHLVIFTHLSQPTEMLRTQLYQPFADQERRSHIFVHVISLCKFHLVRLSHVFRIMIAMWVIYILQAMCKQARMSCRTFTCTPIMPVIFNPITLFVRSAFGTSGVALFYAKIKNHIYSINFAKWESHSCKQGSVPGKVQINK